MNWGEDKFLFRRLLQVPDAARLFLKGLRDQYGAEYDGDPDDWDDATVVATAYEMIDEIIKRESK